MEAVRRRVLIECGAAETRIAALAGEEIVRFWFGPARGDETILRPPQAGDLCLGRVRSVSKSLGGAFVDIGEGCDGFLPIAKEAALPTEGAALVLRVRRPAFGDKGATLGVDWTKGLSEADVSAIEEEAKRAAAPSRLCVPRGADRDPWLGAIQAFAFGEKADALIIDSGDGARALRQAGGETVSVEDGPFETYGAAEMLEGALSRKLALPGGARLTFDQAEAMTVIDVDSGAAADGASGRLNDKVNLAAAKALPAELSRRGVGGRIVIDFLPPSGAEARKTLVAAFKQASRGIFNMRAGKLSADGLFDLVSPRTRLSLMETATEPAGAEWPAPGRRFTLDWTAKRAIGALERALAARPAARPRLLVGGEIDAYLRVERPQWPERLATRFGARFAIAPDEKLEERSFDLAE